jgi:alkanesulfonate monooxygenase SsuD/methylene tetrahydromethanopterin reductase-like flavin-dependent oxidoreductase (luciferase family)
VHIANSVATPPLAALATAQEPAGWHHGMMRFAVNIPNFGDFADPRLVADLARRAEEAGWDGLFVWDHLVHHKQLRREIADPWVLLTAAALATSRIRLGTMITPVARRRVAKLAREVTTLDRLTGGRMILGVGLGAPLDDEYGSFGETTDPKQLAARLDEGLFVMNELWSGSTVTFHGQHVVVDDVAFAPVPVQRPRVPIWVGGNWPAKPPMRRAARWDGAVPIMKVQGLDPAGNRKPPQPDAAFVGAVNAFLRDCRAEAGRAAEPFDLVISGSSEPESATDTVGPLAEAGATWWQECAWDVSLERAKPMLRRVEAGPPLAR